jgi:citrate synthase
MTTRKFTLTDVSSGKSSPLDVLSPSVGSDVVNIAPLAKDHGVYTFDPGFMSTAACESKITYIDGDQGVLLYRGYPVEQLAAKSSFLEVSYLLIYGELPTDTQLAEFKRSITRHTMINESLLRFYNGFHYDAHPMAQVSAVVASMADRKSVG